MLGVRVAATAVPELPLDHVLSCSQAISGWARAYGATQVQDKGGSRGCRGENAFKPDASQIRWWVTKPRFLSQNHGEFGVGSCENVPRGVVELLGEHLLERGFHFRELLHRFCLGLLLPAQLGRAQSQRGGGYPWGWLKLQTQQEEGGSPC